MAGRGIVAKDFSKSSQSEVKFLGFGSDVGEAVADQGGFKAERLFLESPASFFDAREIDAERKLLKPRKAERAFDLDGFGKQAKMGSSVRNNRIDARERVSIKGSLFVL